MSLPPSLSLSFPLFLFSSLSLLLSSLLLSSLLFFSRDASIKTFSYADLPPLSSRIPANPLCDLGTYIDTTQFKKEGRTICKFEDLCENFVDTPMILELWDDNPVLVQKVHNIVFSYRKSKHVVWGNRFSGEIQRNCENYDGLLATTSTTMQWLAIYACYYCGFLPFVPILHFDVFYAVLVNQERCAITTPG